MKKILLTLSIIIIFIVPYFVYAEPILRSGESISVDSEQLLDGDFYGFAQNISISGQAENDVYVIGVNVTLNAPVKEDLTVVGGTVQIHGEVYDDVRILGGNVTIGGRVGGDVFVYGGTLDILSTAYIEGDLIFYGESLRVEGGVNGTIHGSSKKARINSKVGGDVQYVATEILSLGEKAEIFGSISYKSESTLARAEKTIVYGNINRTEITPEKPSDVFEAYIFMLGILIFATLTLYFLSKQKIQQFTTSATKKLGVNGLIGIGILFLIPFVSILLMISVVGMFVGLVLMFSYISALIVSVVFAGIMFGFYIQKVLTKNTTISAKTIIMGSIALSILVFVPYVGAMIVFAGSMVALGNIGRLFYQTVKR